MFSWVGWFLMFCDFEKTFDKLEGWSRWEKMRARRRRKYSLVESFLVELYNIFKRVFLLKVMEWKSGDYELLIAKNMGASRREIERMVTGRCWLIYGYIPMFLCLRNPRHLSKDSKLIMDYFFFCQGIMDYYWSLSNKAYTINLNNILLGILERGEYKS